MQDTTINANESGPDWVLAEQQGRRISDAFYVTAESIQRGHEQTPPFFVDNDVEGFAASTTFKVLELKAEVDLGEIKIFLKVEGSSKPIDSTLLQIYIKRDYLDFQGNPMVKWELIQPKADKGDMAFSIYANDSQTFVLNEKLPIGKYSDARVIFFAAGWQLLADQMAKVTPFEVITTQIRIKKPILEIFEDQVRIVDKKIVIPFVLKFPPSSRPPWNSWWAMAKGGGPGGGLFQQKWLNFGTNVNGVIERTEICKEATGPDKYWYVESTFELPEPEVAGLYNVQYGVFDNNWKETYHWIWPGTDIEVGGSVWVAKCPQEKLPPRLRVKDGKFVKLDGTAYNFYEGTKGADAISTVRGASWGNSYIWTREPAFNRSGYFSSLRYIGHRICRFVFDPDQYTSSKVYRNRILDSINKILIGGMYPLCGPHHLHMQVSSPAERDKKFLEMCEMIANDWKGLPIIYAIASEPKELTGGWPECKALWEKAARKIRAIDPDMFILVPTSGYSKLSTLPESKDLLDRNLVDAYSYHPYNAASDVIPFMKPLLDTGVGIIVEEYGCGNVTWQKSINIEMQKISKQYPNLLSIMTWAWTKYGQDACPMVENGDLANITLTDVGKMQALDIAIWDSGKFIDESGDITPPSVDNEGNVNGGTTGGGTTGGGTTADLSNYPTKTEVGKLISDAVTQLSKEVDAKIASLPLPLSKQEVALLISEAVSSINNKIDSLPKPLSREDIQAMIDASSVTVDPAPVGNVASQVLGILQNEGLISPNLDNRIADIAGLLCNQMEQRIIKALEEKIESVGTINNETVFSYIDSYLKTKVTTLVFNPSRVIGGSTVVGTVSINIPAPRGGAVVGLSSNSAMGIVPQTVTVPEGAVSANFSLRTGAVAAATQCTITATLANGLTSSVVKATLAINPLAVHSLSALTGRLLGGRSTTCTVTLTGPVTEEDVTVNLSSNDPAATLAESIVVNVGTSMATFNVLTLPVAAQKSVILSASFNGTVKSRTLIVDPPVIQSISFSPNPVSRGQITTGKVTLNGPAPENGLAVSLSSTTSFGLPATVTVPAWASEFSFSVTPDRGGISPTVSASLNGVTRTVTLRIS